MCVLLKLRCAPWPGLLLQGKKHRQLLARPCARRPALHQLMLKCLRALAAGAYVYFDYNIVHDDLQTGWCYRRKENFTFRYDALEDELRVT